MKVVVGLGNKGQKYVETRHNVGFIMLDRLSYKFGCVWEDKNKFKSFFCDTNQDLLLVKPQTYMNRSGEAVSKILNFYKIKSNDLIVVHDDVDLDFGKIKVQNDISSAGHGGVQSIIDKLNTKDFYRVRIGVGRPKNKNIETESWVLEKFTQEELNKVENEIFDTFLLEINKLYTLSY